MSFCGTGAVKRVPLERGWRAAVPTGFQTISQGGPDGASQHLTEIPPFYIQGLGPDNVTNGFINFQRSR